MSSRTSFHRAARPHQQHARLLELLYLVCALLLGTLLAATTLAAPLQQTHVRRRGEGGHPPSISPALQVAPRTAVAEFDAK
jgi:hypothetical protein